MQSELKNPTRKPPAPGKGARASEAVLPVQQRRDPEKAGREGQDQAGRQGRPAAVRATAAADAAAGPVGVVRLLADDGAAAEGGHSRKLGGHERFFRETPRGERRPVRAHLECLAPHRTCELCPAYSGEALSQRKDSVMQEEVPPTN